MIPTGWPAAQSLNFGRFRPTNWARDGLCNAAVRTYFRPHGIGSRALHTQHHVSRVSELQLQLLRQRLGTPLLRSRPAFSSGRQYGQVSQHMEILESRFPTKTVLALLLVAVLIYEVNTNLILFASPFLRRLLEETYDDDGTAHPWHYYRDTEAINEHLSNPVLDLTKLILSNPGLIRHILLDEFEKFVYGWAISEKELGVGNMFVTHGCRYRSNEPCEDYFAFGTSASHEKTLWNYWAIYDGHAGRHTAKYLQQALLPCVARAIGHLPSSASPQTITAAIKREFVRVDDEMLNKARHAANSSPAASHTAITALTPVFSGSCALMSIYDPKAKKLRVACTGDSRAVLGRWDSASNSYTCHELSTDQTGFNEAEISRIAAEHPEEPDILNPESGRLMGMAVTRAFGDHRWKWDNEFITKLQYKFWGPAPRPQSKTPPYMTAEPVVTETDIVSVIPDSASNRKITISGSQRTTTQGGSTNEVRRSDFMIMASDGLWDHISSSDAILCVQRWLEARERGEGSVRKDPQWNPTSTSTSGPFSAFSPAPSSSLSSPPSDPSAANSDTADFTYSISKSEEITWAAHPQYFAIEDENAAVCLMKNAMGGTRRELVAGLMSLAGPLRRNAIDDTTIMVVFFDELLQPVGV